MSKTLGLQEALHFRKKNGSVGLKSLMLEYRPGIPDSVTGMRIKMGPFIPNRDAFVFRNSFPMTPENARQIRERFERVGSIVTGAIIKQFATAMTTYSVETPVMTVTIPQVVVDYVIGEISGSLIVDNILGSTLGTMGRCGGMAFAAYDYYLFNMLFDPVNVPPATGVLGDYIFNRLLDSLEKNASTFLDWFINLHVLPILSRAANVALGTAIGSLAGPLGVALGALIGVTNNFFDFGGTKTLLDRTKNEWEKIRRKLDEQAAWPIGLLYSGSITPFDDHQLLAIGYDFTADRSPLLHVWNNNVGNIGGTLKLNFSDEEMNVSIVSGNPGGNITNVKGFFLEDYVPSQPPFYR